MDSGRQVDVRRVDPYATPRVCFPILQCTDAENTNMHRITNPSLLLATSSMHLESCAAVKGGDKLQREIENISPLLHHQTSVPRHLYHRDPIAHYSQPPHTYPPDTGNISHRALWSGE